KPTLGHIAVRLEAIPARKLWLLSRELIEHFPKDTVRLPTSSPPPACSALLSAASPFPLHSVLEIISHVRYPEPQLFRFFSYKKKRTRARHDGDTKISHTQDPFADATKGDDLLPAGTEDYIHIRIQQRNGRKTLTTVQGIADDYDKKKLVKAFKKKFACNGTVIEHPEYGEVIQLQGDQRKNICQFLMEIGIVKEEQLKVHGF
uniref:Eukaryotic translation initiation factor 1B n=1 Tax=Leptobrachium leishanense TaxID=445787 RepID=A0A8C5Q6B3_9ANUR